VLCCAGLGCRYSRRHRELLSRLESPHLSGNGVACAEALVAFNPLVSTVASDVIRHRPAKSASWDDCLAGYFSARSQGNSSVEPRTPPLDPCGLVCKALTPIFPFWLGAGALLWPSAFGAFGHLFLLHQFVANTTT
jgi:hypothetical protein